MLMKLTVTALFYIGWVDVMSVPILGLSLGYMYHPLYPSPKFEVPRGEPLLCDPTQWEPDVISLELEAGPAALRMFGSLLAMLANIKVCPADFFVVGDGREEE